MVKHILIVEDDPVDLKFIQDALSETIPEVEIGAARDGEEALERLESDNKPSIIILDLRMPRMDGHALLHKLKTHQELKRIPAIILSTADAETEIMRCYDEYANAYLVKPDNPAEYRRITKRIKEFWTEEAALVA
ncbi:MAG: response regulator [Pseudomonadota bacterium]